MNYAHKHSPSAKRQPTEAVIDTTNTTKLYRWYSGQHYHSCIGDRGSIPWPSTQTVQIHPLK